MTDNRRERYAVAIAEAAKPEDPDIGHWLHEWFPEADAAMAVGDSEIHTAVYRENDRGGEARRVVGQIRRDLGVEFRGNPWSVENMGKATTAVRELAAENACLRADLGEAREQCTEMEQHHRFAQAEAQGRTDRHYAAIERVNDLYNPLCDAVDTIRYGPAKVNAQWADDLMDIIRAALNGDQS